MESMPQSEAGFESEMLSYEKSLLGRFRGRAEKLAGAFILLSLVACGPKENIPEAQVADPTATGEVLPPEAENPPLVVSEKGYYKKQEEAEGSTAKSHTQETTDESAPSVESPAFTPQDYRNLIKEFYFGEGHQPSGEVYGIPTFDFSKEDMQRMLETAKRMKGSKIFSPKEMSQLDDIIGKLKSKLSPKGENQRQILENAKNFLNQNG